jgi:hypothetical protein
MKKFCMIMIVVALAPMAVVQAGGKGLVVYEVWQNMRNTVTGDSSVFQPLYESPNYPFHPDLSYEFTSFAGLRDWADHYNVRQYGYLTVPTTGSYIFYICSDDQSQLFLSTEGWPDTKVKIAEVLTNCALSPPSWTEFPGVQNSVPIALVAGQVIYLEAIMREWEGSDNIYLGWQGPGIALDIIPGLYASTIHPKAASGPTPADGATLIPTTDQLSWNPPADVNDVATYKVFLGNEPNMLTMPLLANVGAATTANPGTLQNNKTYYWRVETTHSNNGNPFVVRGNFWQFTTIPATPVINPQPQSVFILPGETAVFTTNAQSDTPLTFKWFKIGTPDVQVGTGPTLTIANAQAEAQYYCNITNAGGTAKSDTVSLRLKRLIAHWTLDTDLADATGNLKPGQYFSADSSAPVFEPGVIGNAIAINIADIAKLQYCKLADSSVPELSATGITGNVPRTIACWAKNAVPVGQITNWANVFGFTDLTGTSNQSFDFNRQGDISQYCIHRYGAEWSMHAIDGEWHFLVAAFENGTVRWYADGVYGGEAATDLLTQDIVHLGKRGHLDAVWRGWVDDARIYNYALNAYQVAQLYVDAIPGASICPEYKIGDINRDCKVNMEDFAEMARIWMECGRIPASECAK